MNKDKAALILNTVVQRTAERAIPWTATSSPWSFEASFAKQTLRIEMTEDALEDGGGTYQLAILNGQGNLIDTIQPGNVGKLKNAWATMRALFEDASDQALGVDKNVAELLEALGGPVPLSDGFTDDGFDHNSIPF